MGLELSPVAAVTKSNAPQQYGRLIDCESRTGLLVQKLLFHVLRVDPPMLKAWVFEQFLVKGDRRAYSFNHAFSQGSLH